MTSQGNSTANRNRIINTHHTVEGVPVDFIRDESKSSIIGIILFLLLHIVIAEVTTASTIVSTLYGLIIFTLGLFFLSNDKEPYRLVYIIVYLTGSEVLIRLSDANLFWEFGKYSTTLLMILGMVKYKKIALADKRPLIYFLLLLPSLFVLTDFDRRAISFNMSGPICLATATMFFSTVKLNHAHIKRILILLLAPIIGVCYLATAGTMEFDSIVFGQSAKATTAGYGPNQMSSILGLGALASLLYFFIFKEKKSLKIILICLSLWLIAQCLLTFSRGGLWTMIGAFLTASFFLTKDPRYRKSVLIGGIILISLFMYFILPKLSDFTKGSLVDRFQSFDTTGRNEIALADWYVFKDHPFLGVGPGGADQEHARTFRSAHTHTEYSRILSEHGIMGITALIILFRMTFQRYTSRQHQTEKAIILSFTVWAMLFMLHAAMRLAAPAILFGIGSVSFIIEDKKK